jgi:heme oxygenase
VSDFRKTLKEATRQAHDKVDDGFSHFDISLKTDYCQFLQAQLLGHEAAHSLCAADTGPKAMTSRIQALKDDIAILGGAALKPLPKPSSKAHPLGLTYVIAGSWHGTSVLRKAWSRSSDETVLAANNFMDASALKAEWSEVLAIFKTQSFTSSETEKIVASANQTFAIFEQGLKRVGAAVASE